MKIAAYQNIVFIENKTLALNTRARSQRFNTWLPILCNGFHVGKELVCLKCFYDSLFVLIAMKLLRRRKTILVILVAIWLGGMVYFLIPLTETKDETREAVAFNSILRGDTGETELRALENNNGNLNGGTYEDSVSLLIIERELMPSG